METEIDRLSFLDHVAHLVLLLATVGIIWLCVAGCTLLPETFEVCYIHPKYGQVCVSIDGKRVWKATLTAAEKAEAEKWIDDQEGKSP